MEAEEPTGTGWKSIRKKGKKKKGGESNEKHFQGEAAKVASNSSRLVSTKQTRFHHFTLKWPQLSREALVLHRSATERTTSVTQRSAALLYFVVWAGGRGAWRRFCSRPADQSSGLTLLLSSSGFLEAVLTQMLDRDILVSHQTLPPPGGGGRLMTVQQPHPPTPTHPKGKVAALI